MVYSLVASLPALATVFTLLIAIMYAARSSAYPLFVAVRAQSCANLSHRASFHCLAVVLFAHNCLLYL